MGESKIAEMLFYWAFEADIEIFLFFLIRWGGQKLPKCCFIGLSKPISKFLKIDPGNFSDGTSRT